MQPTFCNLIPLIEEQKEIANHLDFLSGEVQYLEAITEQKLADLNELKQSILQKAFSGELTAAQTMEETVAA